MEDIKLIKGNEAVALGAIRGGCDGYFGYPITPQSEVLETLMELRPWETTGMVVLQAESEVASINMVYGGAACGKRVMTSSSSPGVSLMTEGISYLAGAELPCLIVNVQRGGPGLGTIQPSQSDYFQAVKGGGHGDYHMIVLAPASVQEMYDHVFDGFDLAFRYRVPVMMLADGIIGQMMEKVVMTRQRPRWTAEEIAEMSDSWATTGKHSGRERNVATSLELDSQVMEQRNERLQARYRQIEEREVRFEEHGMDDAEYVMVAFGSSARIASETMEMARRDGMKVGLLRPVTLWPFPSKRIAELAAAGVKGILVPELNAGQMVEDVRLAVQGGSDKKIPVWHYGRLGGMVYSPDDIYSELKRRSDECAG
ncbi:MAG: 3-methyl-2-oxobutanoate dehydrogenase subunit VorB [Alistipes sp.]|jgi:2-oxoglutarate ferredoxin oxidoreductase subunit alpha|nr:3-methyl-2-oxobutanoate dehydrogenase subunit VorB [Alistipes sp.]